MTIYLTHLDTGLRARLRGALERVCEITPPCDVAAVSLDTEHLSPDEQAQLDDGEPLASWVQWWRTQAERICGMEGAALITLQPGLLGQRRAEPLDVDAFQQVIGGRIWSIPSGVILAWGVPERAMNKSHLRRIPCSGALGAAVDGCAAVLVCEASTVSDWGW